jgi:hypothetical protein
VEQLEKEEIMTRKDYERIAQVFYNSQFVKKEIDNWGASKLFMSLVEAMTETLAEDNPQFDAGKFLKATGVKG